MSWRGRASAVAALAALLSLWSPLRGFAADANPPIAGMAYSPSHLLTVDDLERDIPAPVIRDDLANLVKTTRRIRVYSISRQADRILPIARDLGMKVSLGIALSPDLEANDGEIAHGIANALAYSEVVDRIFVGNEVRLRGELPADVLIAYIARIKGVVARAKIPVGTGEVWGVWMEERKLAEASDFIGVHIFPYWDGVPLEMAVDYVGRRYDEMKAAFPGKPIVIAEVGWPSAGERRLGATPSIAAQAAFTRAFIRTAAAAHYDYYLFEAYDQPWKDAREIGGVGAHWGLFDNGRRAKIDLQER